MSDRCRSNSTERAADSFMDLNMTRETQRHDDFYASLFDYQNYRESNPQGNNHHRSYIIIDDNNTEIEPLKGPRRTSDVSFTNGPKFFDWQKQIISIGYIRNYNQKELINFAISQTSTDQGQARKWAYHMSRFFDDDAKQFFSNLFQALYPMTDPVKCYHKMASKLSNCRINSDEPLSEFIDRIMDLYEKAKLAAQIAEYDEDKANLFLTSVAEVVMTRNIPIQFKEALKWDSDKNETPTGGRKPNKHPWQTWIQITNQEGFMTDPTVQKLYDGEHNHY